MSASISKHNQNTKKFAFSCDAKCIAAQIADISLDSTSTAIDIQISKNSKKQLRLCAGLAPFGFLKQPCVRKKEYSYALTPIANQPKQKSNKTNTKRHQHHTKREGMIAQAGNSELPLVRGFTQHPWSEVLKHSSDSNHWAQHTQVGGTARPKHCSNNRYGKDTRTI